MLRIGKPGDPRLWVQIANGIIRDINAGKITARNPLPSQAELAQRHGSSLGPAVRALRELRELSIIYRVPGLGYYIDIRKKLELVKDTSRLYWPW